MTAIGLVCLSTDITSEAMTRAVIPARVRIYTTRTGYDEEDHEAGGFIPIPDWSLVLGTLPPSSLIDVLAFACTAATVALGNEGLRRALSSGRPDLPATSPGIGAVAALNRFGIDRIGLLTPYAPALHDRFPDYLAQGGVEVAAAMSLYDAWGMMSDAQIACVSVDAIADELLRLDARADVQAHFVSCGAFRLGLAELADLSARVRKPVLASIAAMSWHALEIAGCPAEAAAIATACSLP